MRDNWYENIRHLFGHSHENQVMFMKRFAQALVLQKATQMVEVKSAYVPSGPSGQHSFQFL